MIRALRHSAFVRGLVTGTLAGVLIGVPALQLLNASPPAGGLAAAAPALRASASWLADNLGYSVLPFALILFMFARHLRLLQLRLADGSPLHMVSQADQITEVWIGLFFGVGVLWTAIGMRSALLFALGGDDVLAASGAASVLRRLVDGGILTALSTTIVGGGGGYLLRLIKTFSVGPRLKRRYSESEQAQARRVEGLLVEIRERLPREEVP